MRMIMSLLFVLSVSLSASFFPSTVHTTIKQAKGKTLRLSKPFPVTGMSGIVIHRYGKTIDAALGYLVQQNDKGEAVMLRGKITPHGSLPDIKTPPSEGDKVIGGYLYDNVMILAPDEATYKKILSHYRKTWFHPDLLATYLSQEGDAYPTKKTLKAFAKQYQIGLFYIVRRNDAVLYDPISERIVGKKPFRNPPEKARYPFYMRLKEIKAGLFGDEGDGDYYHLMERFQ